MSTQPAFDEDLDDDCDRERCAGCEVALGGPYDTHTFCSVCAEDLARQEREQKQRWG